MSRTNGFTPSVRAIIAGRIGSRLLARQLKKEFCRANRKYYSPYAHQKVKERIAHEPHPIPCATGLHKPTRSRLSPRRTTLPKFFIGPNRCRPARRWFVARFNGWRRPCTDGRWLTDGHADCSSKLTRWQPQQLYLQAISSPLYVYKAGRRSLTGRCTNWAICNYY